MEKDGLFPIVIFGLIAIALYGGSKDLGTNGIAYNPNGTPVKSEAQIQQKITETQYKVDDLKRQVQIESDKKTQSKYKDVITLSYINRGVDAKDEYAVIRMNYATSGTVDVTGWKLQSTNTGESVYIPQATYLFFSGVNNSEEDVLLSKGDVLYLVTGSSPIGASFKVNKCSGYLSQFQTFVPYLGGYCPAPRDENLSSIPKIRVNDACLDYINSMQSCTVQTKTLPNDWSYECTNFITEKINYPSCINTHKGDKDFLQPEWRVYLKRSSPLWKNTRENIILYDRDGMVVSTLTY